MYVDGVVKFVNAAELGAEAVAKESRRERSRGETKLMLVVELEDDKLFIGSYIVGMAGEEKAEEYEFCVEDPPSKGVNSSPKRSMSWKAMFGVRGMLPVDCENKGT